MCLSLIPQTTTHVTWCPTAQDSIYDATDCPQRAAEGNAGHTVPWPTGAGERTVVTEDDLTGLCKEGRRKWGDVEGVQERGGEDQSEKQSLERPTPEEPQRCSPGSTGHCGSKNNSPQGHSRPRQGKIPHHTRSPQNRGLAAAPLSEPLDRGPGRGSHTGCSGCEGDTAGLKR